LDGTLTKIYFLFLIVYVAISCSFYNGNYRVKQLIDFINSDIHVSNIPKREEAQFHLVGNEVYGQNKFSLIVIKKFPQ